jgi:hypothetical protein
MFVVFIRYFWAVLLHKCCILLAGIRINRILRCTSYRVSYKRLFAHDLSKLSREEFGPYAEHFYGRQQHEDQFQQAWRHHFRPNDHHFEHFIDEHEPQIIHPMPDEAIVEMLADNLAASRSYEGYWPDGKNKHGWSWMTQNYDKFRLHPNSQLKFNALLCATGYARVLPRPFDWASIERSQLDTHEKRRLLQLRSLEEINS